MPTVAALRQLVRDVLRHGKLPRREPDRTWGGFGVDAPCAVCEKPITRDDVEYEIQFAHDGASPGLDGYHLHLRCFAAWKLERTKPWRAGPALGPRRRVRPDRTHA
jgi:hypothetical protein